MDKKQEVANKQPKKKKHKGLKIFLIIFGILVVFPVSFVFISFFDTTSKEVSDSEITYQNFVSESFHNGIKKMDKENPQLDFVVDEKMIDGIMMSACDEINQKTYIPKMYCYINGNNYTFVMDITASFFKTRALMHTSLNAEGDSDVRKLVFTINGVTLGRLPIPKNLVTSILGKFINNQTLDDAFAKSGFHIKSDIANGLLTYTRSQFQEDVGVYLSKLGENPYLDVLLSAMGDDTVLKPHYDNGVTATFDLRNLQISDNPEDPSPYYKKAPLEFTDLENHKEEVITLLNAKDGAGNQLLPELDASKVFKYLVRGYDKSDYTIQGYIDSIEETDLGRALASYVKNVESNEIALTEYRGGLTTGKGQFGDYCLSQIEQEKIVNVDVQESPTSVTFYLPTNEFNQLLADKVTEAIGNTIQITFMDEDKWYFDYITVDNIYVGFEDLGEDIPKESRYQFVVYLRLNIAGAPVTAVISSDHIDFELSDDNNKIGNITFELKDIYFGKLHITDSELQKQIIELIPSSLNDFFRYNNGHFEVDIDLLVPNLPYKNEIHTLLVNVEEQMVPNIENLGKENERFALSYTYQSPSSRSIKKPAFM
ncbi:MAG: hypothetical protein MJ214_03070 [Bacilli bacterium]|nr:hypothetical protein [Bacilli bacterium]